MVRMNRACIHFDISFRIFMTLFRLRQEKTSIMGLKNKLKITTAFRGKGAMIQSTINS